MKQIDDINVLHKILLDIAKEFHSVCIRNDIPYYMLGGTMLGAVRHQGFIPWDDDMDFGIPRPYYEKLLKALENELKYPFRCCSYKNNPAMNAIIMKIEDVRTIADDPCVELPLEDKIGINIDVFPLDYCSINDMRLKKIRLLEFIYQTVYVYNIHGSRLKNIIKKILSSICPISKEKMIDYMYKILSKIDEGPMLSNVFGAWKNKECIPIEWYGNKVQYSFEDTVFYGIKDYDSYLTQLYGNYMSLPNGDKHIHLSNVYWK